MPRILCILGAQLLQKVCNANFEHKQLVDLDDFVRAILHMEFACSGFLKMNSIFECKDVQINMPKP